MRDARGPITVSPDLDKARRRRERIPDGWLRRRYDQLVVPAEPPERFATKSLDELAAELSTDDEQLARAVLAEAEATYQEPLDRIEAAERRATTLQGTVAVAASVATASAALVLNSAGLQGAGWRIAFAAVVLGFVVCLIASAARAVSVTGRMFSFEEPGIERIADRAQSGDHSAALTERAAELLRAFAVADMIGSVKVGLLRSAVWWFRRALIFLPLLVALICGYTLWGPKP